MEYACLNLYAMQELNSNKYEDFLVHGKLLASCWLRVMLSPNLQFLLNIITDGCTKASLAMPQAHMAFDQVS